MERTNDRRQYPRLNVAVDIQYRPQVAVTTYDAGVTSNISAGGICLILYEEPRLDSFLELNINLPDGQPVIKTKGKVVWVKPFAVATDQTKRFDAGIAFMDLSEKEKKRIDNYVFKFT